MMASLCLNSTVISNSQTLQSRSCSSLKDSYLKLRVNGLAYQTPPQRCIYVLSVHINHICKTPTIAITHRRNNLNIGWLSWILHAFAGIYTARFPSYYRYPPTNYPKITQIKICYLCSNNTPVHYTTESVILNRSGTKIVVDSWSRSDAEWFEAKLKHIV